MSKLSEASRVILLSRLTEKGSGKDMKNLKGTLQQYVKQLETENTSGIKTMEYKKGELSSTKTAKAEELQKMMSPLIVEEKPITKITVGSMEYAIPAKAISEAGVDEGYVEKAIQHGKQLLDEINALSEAIEGVPYVLRLNRAKLWSI
ncbi:MAG: hypothetical protein LBR92_04185 [Puniceicoccales bacterium]|jgi:hypothetical protein|nr:hypothetical protein [Puniceicoccales bacterium]